MAGIVREERLHVALWTNSTISRPKPSAMSVTDPMGNATQYEYSPTTGTLTSITNAEGGVISYEYDLLGRLTKLTDQNGHQHNLYV